MLYFTTVWQGVDVVTKHSLRNLVSAINISQILLQHNYVFRLVYVTRNHQLLILVIYRAINMLAQEDLAGFCVFTAEYV